MHGLSHVVVENFRSCRRVEIQLGACTPLVGYNNGGKSNLLDALGWFVTPRSLPGSAFNDPGEPVAVTGRIEGLESGVLDHLEAKHRSKIEPYIKDGELFLRRVQAEPSLSASQIKLQVSEVIDPDGTITKWKDNPSGIPEALKRLLPEPIAIGAMEDAAEDASKAKSTSTIGKLLKEFTGPTEQSHGAEIASALGPLKNRLTAEGNDKAEELARFDREATNALGAFFPGIDLHVDIPVPTVSELFAKGTVRVRERGWERTRDFSDLGHGAQRSIQMALVRYLSELKAREGGSGQRRLLLLEEPELYLHPQATLQLNKALKNLSVNGYQVVYATHSPLMIDRHDIPETHIVRKGRDLTTQVMPTARDALQRRVDEEDKRLHALARMEAASEWLFSDAALIVEGATEQYLLPSVYEAIAGVPPEEDSLAIIGPGGASNIPGTLAVMRELGIEACALVDIDFAINDAVKSNLLDPNDKHIQECLRQVAEMAASDPDICVGDNGRPRNDKDNPNGKRPATVLREWCAQEESRPVASALHDKLKGHGIWLWTGGDIEYHLGIAGPKDVTSWAPFRAELSGRPYHEVIFDSATVEALIKWIRDGVLTGSKPAHQLANEQG